MMMIMMKGWIEWTDKEGREDEVEDGWYFFEFYYFVIPAWARDGSCHLYETLSS